MILVLYFFFSSPFLLTDNTPKRDYCQNKEVFKFFDILPISICNFLVFPCFNNPKYELIIFLLKF
ncbi:MAG: hypothetical protein A3B95_02830 [Candidatus Doudnabacteria bacterium RIFCSPHIGHO2_02_FULL_43_13b]|nr:MAG: hypothetical protein A3B95_02830 [Candidatus Doudnabacteria bacterium RIFCSPHIGHO2_02_FULL_43_13b]